MDDLKSSSEETGSRSGSGGRGRKERSSLVHSESAGIGVTSSNPFRSYQLPQQSSAPENISTLIAAVQPYPVLPASGSPHPHTRPTHGVLSTFQSPVSQSAVQKPASVLTTERKQETFSLSDSEFAPLLADEQTTSATSAGAHAQKRNSLNPFPLSPVDVCAPATMSNDVTDAANERPLGRPPALMKEMSDYDNLVQIEDNTCDVITTPTNESSERNCFDHVHAESDSDTLSTASVEQALFEHMNRKRQSLTSAHSSNDQASLVLMNTPPPSPPKHRKQLPQDKPRVSFNPYDTSLKGVYFGNFGGAKLSEAEKDAAVTSSPDVVTSLNDVGAEVSMCVPGSVDGMRATGRVLELRGNATNAVDETTI